MSDTCSEVDVVDDAEVGGAFHGDLDRLDVVTLENADVSCKTLCFHGEGGISGNGITNKFEPWRNLPTALRRCGFHQEIYALHWFGHSSIDGQQDVVATLWNGVSQEDHVRWQAATFQRIWQNSAVKLHGRHEL